MKLASNMKEVITVESIINAAKNKNMRIFATKQGALEGQKQLVGGNSVEWKGVKGINNIRNINARVAAGLQNAIRISERHTEKGEALVTMPNGDKKYMPVKAAMMALEAGDNIRIRNIGSSSIRAGRSGVHRRENITEQPGFERGIQM